MRTSASFAGLLGFTGILIVASWIPTLARAQEASVIATAKNGAWSDAATWEGGRVPDEGSRVLIREGHEVRYDVASTVPIRVIHVAGELNFASDRDTRLDVGLIKVQTGADVSEEGFDCDAHAPSLSDADSRPSFYVGTPNRPIESGHQARIRLVYFEGMNKESCPAIVCCGGRMEFHGSPMNLAWVKLGQTAQLGDTTVTSAEPLSGWRIGDQLIVTSTVATPVDADQKPGTPRDYGAEERLLVAIDGTRLTLDRPLTQSHLGEGDFRGEIANLSRNVVVESADPEGTRGHTMYHRGSAGSIGYAEFRGLGKEGILGRYSLHFHLAGDTMRGSSVIGASIWNSRNRWLTIHGTNYLVVRDCVGFDSVGHGFFLEDGTEVYNVLDRNLAVRARVGKPLPRQVLPFDANEGAGFWWANSLNTFTRNVSCENGRYGYRFEATQTSALAVTFPIQQPDGLRRDVDIRTLPFTRFEGNESHCEGLYGFNLGEGVERVGPDARHPFIVRDTLLWRSHYAFRPQVPSLLVEKMRIHQADYGVYHPNFDNPVYRDLTIAETDTEPFNRGHDDLSAQHGALTVDGLTFIRERSGSHMPLIQISDNNPTGMAETHIRGLRLVDWTGDASKAVVNRGGGPRDPSTTKTGAPIYVHDWFGPGRHAKVVSPAWKDFAGCESKYRELPPLTGDETRAMEVTHLEFPTLLSPVDDLPPTTVITHVSPGENNIWLARGVTSDNGSVARVMVNGQPAKATRENFAEWEAILDLRFTDGKAEIEAFATDATGAIEPRPHRRTVIR